jgi:hypothetical protein
MSKAWYLEANGFKKTTYIDFSNYDYYYHYLGRLQGFVNYMDALAIAVL